MTEKRTVEELRAELRKAEALQEQEIKERRKTFKVRYRYQIRPYDRNSTFDKIYDPTCLRYRLSRTCLNREEAKAAGYNDFELTDGSMSYMFNTVTGKIICATGGGTSYISERWNTTEKDGADDWAFEQIGEFLTICPYGGDITAIVEAYLERRASGTQDNGL